jgi:hypothetical protein
MSRFIEIFLFMIFIVAAVPVVVTMMNMGGANVVLEGTAGALDEYSLPNLEQYTTQSDNPVDLAVVSITMAVTSIFWLLTLVAKAVFLFPILIDLFGVPTMIAGMLSVGWYITIFLFISQLWSNRNLDQMR